MTFGITLGSLFNIQLGNGHGNGNAFGHNRGPGDGPGRGRGEGPGREAGGLRLEIGALGANLDLGFGGFAGVPATLGDGAFIRPNDEQNDPDAVARLRRQAESIDLQSGRDVNQQTFSTRGTQGSGQTAAAAAPQGLPGAAAPVGAPTGAADAGGAAAGYYGSLSGRAAAGSSPVSLSALDRVVTALADPATAQPGQTRGGGAPGETASPAAVQSQPGVAVALRTGGDMAPVAPAARAEAAAATLGFAAAAQQDPAARPATGVQPQPAALANIAAANPVAANPAVANPAVANPVAANPTVASQPAAANPAVVQQMQNAPTLQAAVQAGAVQAAVQSTPAQVAAVANAAQQSQPAIVGQQTPATAATSPTTPASQPAAVDPKMQSAPQMAQIGTEAAIANALAPATGGAPVGGPFGAPVEPVAALGPQAAGEAFVKRQVLAVEQAERNGGPAAALRELNGRVRDMPSDSAAKVLADLQPMLGRAADAHAGGQRIERVEKVNGILERSSQEISARAAMIHTGADLAAALDAGALDGMSAHVAKDVARAIANNEKSNAERVIAFGQAVAFGSGLTLPFALIEAFDEQGDGESARALETALAGGLARLLHRLNEAVEALSRAAGPIAFEWTAWRAAGVAGPELERRLRVRLSMHEGLIAEIDEALDAVDAAGGDMVRALERLSRWTARTPEIAAVWREATASRKTAFAIAQSLAAQHVVVQALAAGLRSEPPGAPDAFSREAAQALYQKLGFAKDGAAELAEITFARHEAIQMTGGWLRARKAADPSAEAAFARIVAFLSGHCAPTNRHIETVSFADLDPDGERPITLVGAPLLERFELMEAA